MSAEDPVETLMDDAPPGFSLAFAVFFFVFGISAGFLIAFAGVGFLEESAGVIAGVFLGLIALTAVVGVLLFAFRKRLLRMLFGIADAEVRQLSAPLSEMAVGMAMRDPAAAAGSAQRLIRAAMARYAWLSTRRWIMTSLTALIAAMAALAGTALLFKQNALLGGQIALMEIQNQRLENQNALMAQQTELLVQQTDLAEAARNAGQAAELAELVARISAAAEAAQPEGAPLDAEALGRALVARIVLTSQGVRPYRFLDLGLTSDVDDQGRMAMLARRAVMPRQWQVFAESYGWSDVTDSPGLVDRPGSPERGHLLRALLLNGVRDFRPLVGAGLELAFAYAPESRIDGASLRGSNLTLADLSRSRIANTDFSQASLANLRFVLSELIAVDFAHDPEAEGYPYTDLTGADFTQAALVDCAFGHAFGFASVFDEAVLVAPDFTATTLVAASFRDAVLIAPVWDGAVLAMADFDGAYVFGDDPLAAIAGAAQGFDPSLYRADPVTVDEAAQVSRWEHNTRDRIEARVGDAPAWRLVRTGSFE